MIYAGIELHHRIDILSTLSGFFFREVEAAVPGVRGLSFLWMTSGGGRVGLTTRRWRQNCPRRQQCSSPGQPIMEWLSTMGKLRRHFPKEKDNSHSDSEGRHQHRPTQQRGLFFVCSLLACDLSRSWRDYDQSFSCPLSAQCRPDASAPLPSAQACPKKKRSASRKSKRERQRKETKEKAAPLGPLTRTP